MSKFVGKFRNNRDYSDEYGSTKSFDKYKKPKNQNAELKKLKFKQYDDEEEMDSFDYEMRKPFRMKS